MKYTKILLLALPFILITSIGVWMGYEKGFTLGEQQGRISGYEKAMVEFPQMTWDNLTFTDDNRTISIGSLTIIGEQHILDIINDLPNISRIISFNQVEN